MRNFGHYVRQNFLIKKRSPLVVREEKCRSVSGKLVKQSSQSDQSPSSLVCETN